MKIKKNVPIEVLQNAIWRPTQYYCKRLLNEIKKVNPVQQGTCTNLMFRIFAMLFLKIHSHIVQQSSGTTFQKILEGGHLLNSLYLCFSCKRKSPNIYILSLKKKQNVILTINVKLLTE